MAKKILKKAKTGREVTKSESGQYKIIENPTKGVTKSRRTIEGFIKGAPSIKKVKENYNNVVDDKFNARAEMRSWNTGASEDAIKSATKIPTYKEYLMKQKSGGTIKKTLTKKKK